MRALASAGLVALLAVLLVLTLTSCDPLQNTLPFNLHLTWQDDSSTTMTVNFQTRDRIHPDAAPYVYFTERDSKALFSCLYCKVEGTTEEIVVGGQTRYLHTVPLTGLEPGATYRFVAGLQGGLLSPQYEFQTIPNDGSPINFVTGGDMDITVNAENVLFWASQEEPMFFLLGGDIAYANGSLDNYERWDDWFAMYDRYMTSETGRLVPMIIAIGNHETAGSFDQSPDKAPFYFTYFAQGGRSYFSRTFGEHLVIYVLDSSHVNSHQSQAPWLRSEMLRHADVQHQFAVYHVPLYPAHRGLSDPFATRGRTHWGPLFDEFGLDTAFENHDHLLKRTHRIFGGEPGEEGTLYLGDGALGRGLRPVNTNPADEKYFALRQQSFHFWSVQVSANGVSYEAIGDDGQVLDAIVTTVAQ